MDSDTNSLSSNAYLPIELTESGIINSAILFEIKALCFAQ